MNTYHRLKDRLVIVSNRLPVVLKSDDSGRWKVEPGSGGLVDGPGAGIERLRRP